MLILNLHIKVNSSNKIQLKKFLVFLKTYKTKCKLNLKIEKFSNILTKQKKFAVLKSPHVHKIAQEHFSLVSHSLFLRITDLHQLDKLLLFIKFANFILFEIKFKLQFEFLLKKIPNNLLHGHNNSKLKNTFNPNKFLAKNLQVLRDYVKLFEIFGEFKLLRYSN